MTNQFFEGDNFPEFFFKKFKIYLSIGNTRSTGMSDFEKKSLNKVVRDPKRATYDKQKIYQILDDHFLCHMAYVFEGIPIVIPTAYGRKKDTLYVHGAAKNRMIQSMLSNDKVSVTVTHTDGIVMARSVFHHSFNYRSAVLFGKPRLVTDENERLEALETITENIVKGRWNEARKPNAKELKATIVLAIEVTDASAKTRTGPPVDEPEDYGLDVWAGIVPVDQKFGEPVPDPELSNDVPVPESLKALGC